MNISCYYLPEKTVIFSVSCRTPAVIIKQSGSYDIFVLLVITFLSFDHFILSLSTQANAILVARLRKLVRLHKPKYTSRRLYERLMFLLESDLVSGGFGDAVSCCWLDSMVHRKPKG